MIIVSYKKLKINIFSDDIIIKIFLCSWKFAGLIFLFLMYYKLHVNVIEAVDIPKMDEKGTDAYCVVKAESEKHKTSIQVKTAHPHWSQAFHFKVSNPTNGVLKIKMKDHDPHKDDKISFIQIPYCSLPLGQNVDQWYDMISYNPGLSGGKLHLYIHMAYHDQQPFRNGYQKLAKKDQYAKPLYMTQGYGAPMPDYQQQNYVACPNSGYPQQQYVAPPPQVPCYQQQVYNAAPAPCYPQQGYAASQPQAQNYQQQGYPSPTPGYPQASYPQQPGYGIPPPVYQN